MLTIVPRTSLSHRNIANSKRQERDGGFGAAKTATQLFRWGLWAACIVSDEGRTDAHHLGKPRMPSSRDYHRSPPINTAKYSRWNGLEEEMGKYVYSRSRRHRERRPTWKSEPSSAPHSPESDWVSRESIPSSFTENKRGLRAILYLVRSSSLLPVWSRY